MKNSSQPLDPQAILAEADWIRSLARRLLRDQHQADDVAQEAMVAALQGAPQPVASHRGWLAGVVRNLAWKAQRGDRRRDTREKKAHAPVETSAPDDLVDRAVTMREVMQAVIELPEPYRSTVMRHYFDHQSATKIAKQEGVPAATVRTRLHRAHNQLRIRLQNKYGKEEFQARMLAVAGPAFSMLPPLITGATVMSSGWKLGLAGAVLAAAGIFWKQSTDTEQPDAVIKEEVAVEAPEVLEVRANPEPETVDDKEVRRNVSSIAPEEPKTKTHVTRNAAEVVVQVAWKESEAPVAQLELLLYWSSLENSNWNIERGRTDQNGECQFEVPYPCELHEIATAGQAGKPNFRKPANRIVDSETTEPFVFDLDDPGRVQGFVEDLDGNRVANAEVNLWLQPSILAVDWGTTQPTAIVNTDDNGNFVVENVPGVFQLAAHSERHMPVECVEGKLGPRAEAKNVRLIVGPRRQVQGQVVDTLGNPVPHVGLSFNFNPLQWGRMDQKEDYHVSYVGAPFTRILAGEEGKFNFEAPSSSARIYVRRSGYPNWEGRLGAEQDWLEVTLKVSPKISGQLVSNARLPLTNANLFLFSSYSHWNGSHILAKDDNTFVFDSLNFDGEATLIAWADGHAMTVVNNLTIAQNMPPITVELDRQQELRGTVLNVDGSPAAFAKVKWKGTLEVVDPAKSKTNRSMTAEELLNFSEARTDAEGKFDLPFVYLGEFELWVTPEGSKEIAAYKNVHSGAGDLEIVLGTGLEAQATVRGQVLCSDTGMAPEGGFYVTVYLDKGNFVSGDRVHIQSADGNFELNGFPPEQVRGINISAENYAYWRDRSFDYSEANTLYDVRVTLHPKRNLEVRVFGSDGNPVYLASIFAVDGEGTEHWMEVPNGLRSKGVTNEDGRASMHGLPAIPLTLKVTTTDDESKFMEFPVSLVAPYEGEMELHLTDL